MSSDVVNVSSFNVFVEKIKLGSPQLILYCCRSFFSSYTFTFSFFNCNFSVFIIECLSIKGYLLTYSPEPL